MAISLVTTLSGLTSTSYVTLVEAKAYMDNRRGSEPWTLVDANEKARALIGAAQRLDRENFIGDKVVWNQALEWPRRNYGYRYAVEIGTGAGVVDLRGCWWPASAVPQPVKDAQCELALQYVIDLGAASVGAGSGRITHFSQDGLSITYDVSSVSTSDLPRESMKLLGAFRLGKRLVRS